MAMKEISCYAFQWMLLLSKEVSGFLPLSEWTLQEKIEILKTYLISLKLGYINRLKSLNV